MQCMENSPHISLRWTINFCKTSIIECVYHQNINEHRHRGSLLVISLYLRNLQCLRVIKSNRSWFTVDLVVVVVRTRSVMSYSLWPHRLYPARLLCPQNFPGKNAAASCHFLLQEIIPSQGSDPHFLHLLHQQAGSLPQAPPRKPIAMSSLVFKNYRLLDRARRFITLLKIDEWNI